MSTKFAVELFVKSLYHIVISRFRDDKRIIKTYWGHDRNLYNYGFDSLKNDVLNYVESMRIGECDYRFAASQTQSNIYSNVYACMIRGLFQVMDQEEKRRWADHFNRHQGDDGLFYDNNIKSKMYETGEGWGAHHFVPHVLIAYERIGSTPQKKFLWLEKYYSSKYVTEWIRGLDFSNAWGTSNQIMNLMCSLQYARDYMDEDIGDGLECLEANLQQFLTRKHLHGIPLWTANSLLSKDARYDAARGAYHIYPQMIYDRQELNVGRAIPFFLSLQNRHGGFAYSTFSSACEDIDCIDPLIRLSLMSNNRSVKTDNALLRAYCHVLSNQNTDGGFVFSRRGGFVYGDCDLLRSNENESNLLGTWFRTVSLVEIMHYFGVAKFNGTAISGYEMRLPEI